MDERSAARWEKRRKAGRKKFIRYYALVFGIGFAIILSLIEWSSFAAIDYRWVVVRLLFFATIGFLTGVFSWEAREKRYLDYRNTSPGKKL